MGVQTRAYKVKRWADAADFLTQVARASGKLARGGEPDLNTAARMVLLDWQRGKLPFFSLPPDYAPDAPVRVSVPALLCRHVSTHAMLVCHVSFPVSACCRLLYSLTPCSRPVLLL